MISRGTNPRHCCARVYMPVGPSAAARPAKTTRALSAAIRRRRHCRRTAFELRRDGWGCRRRTPRRLGRLENRRGLPIASRSRTSRNAIRISNPNSSTAFETAEFRTEQIWQQWVSNSQRMAHQAQLELPTSDRLKAAAHPHTHSTQGAAARISTQPAPWQANPRPANTIVGVPLLPLLV